MPTHTRVFVLLGAVASVCPPCNTFHKGQDNRTNIPKRDGRLRSELTQHPSTVTPTNLPDLPPTQTLTRQRARRRRGPPGGRAQGRGRRRAEGREEAAEEGAEAGAEAGAGAGQRSVATNGARTRPGRAERRSRRACARAGRDAGRPRWRQGRGHKARARPGGARGERRGYGRRRR